MNKFDLQKLRDLPIEGVAQRLGLKVIRHKTLCPFHNDSNPSLSFHIRTNTYKCFVCDAHGSTIDLAMQVLGKDFKETCQWLADEWSCLPSSRTSSLSSRTSLLSSRTCFGICNEQMLKQVQHDKGQVLHDKGQGQHDNPEYIAQKYSKYFERPFLNQAARAFLYEERKLDARIIRWCKLTSWTDRYGTSWLQIPYFDINGQLIGVQNRRLSHYHDGQPRFRFPKGSSCKIYNLPVLNLLKEGEELWIAEGCSDCWALLSSGKKAIAIPSATLLKPKDLEILKVHYSTLNLHMAPDKDAPGEKLFQELKKLLPSLTHHSLPEGYKDFAEWYILNC